MVHDLTANSDFSKHTRFGFRFRLEDRNDSTNPKDEVVYTGDALERENKRYCVDYNEDKTICDCCGGYIDKVPWHWNDENKTLCDICDSLFAKGGINDLLDGSPHVIGTFPSGVFQLSKPWTIDENERENAIDNVLLWD